MSLNGFEEKMAKIGRTFRDEITLKADDAIEDLTDIMQKGDKVIGKLQKKEQLNKEKEIKDARIDERKKILGQLKGKKNSLFKKKVNKLKPKKKTKKIKKNSNKKIVRKSRKIEKKKILKTFKTKITKPNKSAKQKMESLSPNSVKIKKEVPILTIAKDFVKEVGKNKSKNESKNESKNKSTSKIKQDLIRNKIKQGQLASRIKIGEFISIISNILILICFCIFIYYKMISSEETKDSMVYWLSSKLLIIFIILILVGSFLKFNGLWFQITDSLSKWQETLSFDFQLQFYISVAFVILLQIWTFIINGEYDELFPTKTPLYLFGCCLMCMCVVNLGLSIGNFRSRTGSIWIDFKDKMFKQFGMDYMVSDSTKLNPMDEMMQEFQNETDDNETDNDDNEDYDDDDDDEDYDDDEEEEYYD
jgi:succinate dehydrogenase hydrophobic anchor subunit